METVGIIHAVQFHKQVEITKREKSVKICHKSGDIQENCDLGGSRERAVKGWQLCKLAQKLTSLILPALRPPCLFALKSRFDRERFCKISVFFNGDSCS